MAVRSEETTRKKTETTRARRLARRAAMTPTEREEAAAMEFAWRSAAARKAWRTRRARMGVDGPAEPTKPVQLYTADLRELARLVPGVRPRDAVRMAVGALRRELGEGGA